MPDLSASARRLYRRLLQKPPELQPGAEPVPPPLHPQPELEAAGAVQPGEPGEADGASAVAVVEAWVADAAGLGATFPANAAGRRFRHEAEHEVTNLFRRLPASVPGAGGRGSLAAAVALAAGGQRAAAFLSGPDLLASQDLLAEAARRRLPLVVHLMARAGARNGLGSGHEAYHAAASSGAVLLYARNVQEAADLTLVGRRLAEDALVPVVVAMDGPETALAVQDLLMPPPEVMRRYLGDPGDRLHPPTPGQELVFGKHRRRVPRWHDLERPLLTGAAHGPEAYAQADTARRVFFDVHLPALWERAAEGFAAATGRRYPAFSSHRVKGAEIVLVAQGSAVETAEAVAEHLRHHGGPKVGVVGLRALRPFPKAELALALHGHRGVAVLERTDAPALAEPPLRRELEAAAGKDLPVMTSVLYGLGGCPLRASDLAALCHQLARVEGAGPALLHLGFDMVTGDDAHPKRQAVSDAVERSYFGLAHLGVRTLGEPPEVRPKGAFTVSVHRHGDGSAGHFSNEAATLLRRLLGGHLRSRSSFGWEQRGQERVDTVTHAPEPLLDPGDDAPAEVAIWLPPELRPSAAATVGAGHDGRGVLRRLVAGGAIVVPGDPAVLRQALPPFLCRGVHDRGLKLYAVAGLDDLPAEVKGSDVPHAAVLHREDRLLGALLGVLQAEGRIDVTLRKALKTRREMLAEHQDPHLESRLDAFQAGFEKVAQLDVPAPAAAPAQDVREPAVPPAVRRLGGHGGPLGDLAEYWGRIGVLYHEGAAHDLTPEPLLATGAVPPLAAALRPAPTRAVLPAFDPAACTGCGDCWTVCPDGAVAVSVVAAEKLIDLGMAQARDNGRSTDALRMISGKLAGEVRKEMAAGRGDGPAGPVLDAAFATLFDKLKLPDERKTAIREAFEATRDEVAELVVARTQPFFDDADAGELLALAVDPDACKGCGLCVAACEPEALTSAADDPRRAALARRQVALAAELPPASDGTLERVAENPDVGPLAAALLDPAARAVMAAGGGEAGSGESVAVRQLLGTAAARLAPRRKALESRVGELREELAEAIRKGLASALPVSDLDALAQGLGALGKPDAELRELTERVETAFETGRVDVVKSRRLVDAARALADLEHRLTRGESGLGRAPFGVVLGPGFPTAAWGAFPHNPFAVPAAVDATGDTGDLARGLVEGHVRDTLELVRTLRRAKLELEPTAKARRTVAELETLTWQDLGADERTFCPPLFVVVTEESLRGPGLAGLLEALATDLPLKVAVLTDPPGNDVPFDLVHLVSSLPGVVAAQTSIADAAHLAGALAAALDHAGPALLRVHAPSPERHGFPADATVAKAREALETGTFKLSLGDVGQAPPADSMAAKEAEAALEALRQQHAAELAALRADYEARLATSKATIQVEMAQKIRGRLLQLALGAARDQASTDQTEAR